MLKYFLAPDIYVCTIDEGAIFLDLNTHTYFAIDSGSARDLADVVHGWPIPARSKTECAATPSSSVTIVSKLLEKHVLTETDMRDSSPVTTANKPRHSCATTTYTEPRPSISLGHVMRFIHSCFLMALNLRLRRLKAAVRTIRKRRSRGGAVRRASSIDEIRDFVALFRRLRLWAYTTEDTCLFDSLTIAHFLSSYGIAPTITIGVSTKPFASHAWVQVGDLVLNDSVENVVQYTPILVI